MVPGNPATMRFREQTAHIPYYQFRAALALSDLHDKTDLFKMHQVFDKIEQYSREAGSLVVVCKTTYLHDKKDEESLKKIEQDLKETFEADWSGEEYVLGKEGSQGGSGGGEDEKL